MIATSLSILLCLIITFASSTPLNSSAPRLPSDTPTLTLPFQSGTTGTGISWPRGPTTYRVSDEITIFVNATSDPGTEQARRILRNSLNSLRRELQPPLDAPIDFDYVINEGIVIGLEPIDEFRPRTIKRGELRLILAKVLELMRKHGVVEFQSTIEIDRRAEAVFDVEYAYPQDWAGRDVSVML